MTSLDRLFRRRMALILDEPFFGMLLMNLRLVEDPALDPPTMCTNGEDLRFHPGFVAECDDFAKKYGNQFEVPKMLRDMAAKGESFYGKYQAAKAA